MSKITLSDNTGRWFNLDLAKRWDEARVYADDGTAISLATQNSWEHETLFLTRAGMFIIHCLDEHNPTLQSFVEFGPEKAVEWLLKNGYPDDVGKMEYRKDMESHEC